MPSGPTKKEIKMKEKYLKILERGLRLEGLELQFNQTSEEVGELLVAINHYRRERVTKLELLEEITDVRMMLDMIELGLDLENDENYQENFMENLEDFKYQKYIRYLDKIEREP